MNDSVQRVDVRPLARQISDCFNTLLSKLRQRADRNTPLHKMTCALGLFPRKTYEALQWLRSSRGGASRALRSLKLYNQRSRVQLPETKVDKEFVNMERIEKTVFLSYRRAQIAWALAIFKDLTQHGYDVFFDFNGIASGDFERVILGNIDARAHFLVLLTPSALRRCNDSADWLRREIEAALDSRRNIVPLMLEGFDFGMPKIANGLTGRLAALKHYSGVRIPPDYFDEAMARLRCRYLNVPLSAVLHPASPAAQRAATLQKVAADAAPTITTAQQWFSLGHDAVDIDEKVRFYSEAIRLKPDYTEALNNRGLACMAKGDLEAALKDYTEAIRLKPDYVGFYYNRGHARRTQEDSQGAAEDFKRAKLLQATFD